MNKSIIILIILVALFVIQIVVERIIRKKTVEELYALISKKEFEKFEDKIKQKKTIRALGVFNSEFLKLNVYKIQKSNEKINKQLSFINDNVNMNKKQKQVFYPEAFGYYVSTHNKKDAYNYLMNIKDNCENYIFNKCKILYDIEIEKDDSYLETLLEEIKDPNLSKKVLIEKYSLILKIYENKNDNKKIVYYQNIIKNILK